MFQRQQLKYKITLESHNHTSVIRLEVLGNKLS